MSKRRALRAQPKVARRRLNLEEGYVEFLQFIHSPPGTTLDQISQRKEAARVAALTAALLPHRDVSRAKAKERGAEESNNDTFHEQTAGRYTDRAKRTATSLQATSQPVDLSSELAALSLSGARGPQARENYSALTSIVCGDDEVPNLDELSCMTSQTCSFDGNQVISPVDNSSHKTNTQDVLAWAALSMFLGQPAGRSFAPLSVAKNSPRGNPFGADGWEEAMPPSIEGTPTEGRRRTESVEDIPAGDGARQSGGFPAGEPRYDSVEATAAGRAARSDHLLRSVCDSVCDSSDSSRFDDSPRSTGTRPVRAKGGASPSSAERSDSVTGAATALESSGSVPAVTSPQPVFRASPQPSAKKRRGFLEKMRLKVRLGSPKLPRGLRRGRGKA